jgi:hypothetical protein
LKRRDTLAFEQRYPLMLRFYVPIAILAGVTSLVACSGQDPVADNASDNAAVPAEVDVLPPDESDATPTNDLENGDDEDVKRPATRAARRQAYPRLFTALGPDSGGLRDGAEAIPRAC